MPNCIVRTCCNFYRHFISPQTLSYIDQTCRLFSTPLDTEDASVSPAPGTFTLTNGCRLTTTTRRGRAVDLFEAVEKLTRAFAELLSLFH